MTTKPDMTRATKAVREYVEHLEREAAGLRWELDRVKQEQEPVTDETRMFAAYYGGRDVTTKLNERDAVTFKVGPTRYDTITVRFNNDFTALDVMGDLRGLTLTPCASNHIQVALRRD